MNSSVSMATVSCVGGASSSSASGGRLESPLTSNRCDWRSFSARSERGTLTICGSILIGFGLGADAGGSGADDAGAEAGSLFASDGLVARGAGGGATSASSSSGAPNDGSRSGAGAAASICGSARSRASFASPRALTLAFILARKPGARGAGSNASSSSSRGVSMRTGEPACFSSYLARSCTTTSSRLCAATSP